MLDHRERRGCSTPSGASGSRLRQDGHKKDCWGSKCYVHEPSAVTRKCRWNMEPRVTRLTRRRRSPLHEHPRAPFIVCATSRAGPPGTPSRCRRYAPAASNRHHSRELAHLMSPIPWPQIVVDNQGGANGSLGLRSGASRANRWLPLSYTSPTVVVNPWGPERHDRHPRDSRAVCQTTPTSMCAGREPKCAGQHVPQVCWRWRKRSSDSSLPLRRAWAAATTCRARLFADAAGNPLTRNVPYRGTARALAYVISGHESP